MTIVVAAAIVEVEEVAMVTITNNQQQRQITTIELNRIDYLAVGALRCYNHIFTYT
jgi:hypothetical protein